MDGVRKQERMLDQCRRESDKGEAAFVGRVGYLDKLVRINHGDKVFLEFVFVQVDGNVAPSSQAKQKQASGHLCRVLE